MRKASPFSWVSPSRYTCCPMSTPRSPLAPELGRCASHPKRDASPRAIASASGLELVLVLALLPAAALAAWLCGRASERAITDLGQSTHSLCAGDTLACLGRAFTDWRERSA